jgi:cell division septal protein FtsQ
VRELPNTLRISVHERTSAAVILDHEFALVDAEGVVLSLPASYPEGFPLITGVSEPLEPGRLIAGAVPAMEVLRTIASSGLLGPERISELRVDGDTVQVSLMNSGTVLVLGHGDTGTQVRKLDRLMEAGVFDARAAGYDLRFDGRVVGMTEGKSNAIRGMGLSPAGG